MGVVAVKYADQFESALWHRWQDAPYPLICADYPTLGYGADFEPHSSLWMAHLADAMGKHFREGMKLLDYGCGAARFANFMSGRLQDFTYYGLEPKESHCGPGIGPNGVDVAREIIGHDPRIHLGYLGDDLEPEAIAAVDVALLGSVFTHLRIEDSLDILDELQLIVERDGAVVFTAILGDDYSLVGPGGHGMADCFAVVTNTPEQFYGRGHIVGKYVTMCNGLEQTIYRYG